MKVEFTLAKSVEQFEVGLITAEELTQSRPTIKLTIDPLDPHYGKLLEFLQAHHCGSNPPKPLPKFI
tara:strand:+ start:333 stop:533 length:201 start_codon:yes stop_codon:yes gene_type:complete